MKNWLKSCKIFMSWLWAMKQPKNYQNNIWCGYWKSIGKTAENWKQKSHKPPAPGFISCLRSAQHVATYCNSLPMFSHYYTVHNFHGQWMNLHSSVWVIDPMFVSIQWWRFLGILELLPLWPFAALKDTQTHFWPEQNLNNKLMTFS